MTQNALYLLAEKGSLNQRNMANSLHVTGQAVSELLKKLEERELITKESGELNNENIISLTPKGAEIAKKVHDTMQGMSEEFFADFSQEEMETLYQLLLKVEQKLATRE